MINNEIELDNNFSKCQDLFYKLEEVVAIKKHLDRVIEFDSKTKGRVMGWDLDAKRELAKEFNRLIIEYVEGKEETA